MGESGTRDSDTRPVQRDPLVGSFPLPGGPRWALFTPFAMAGLVGVVGGGLVAAVSGPTGFEHGSWVAAYLVLVVGVAQLVLGAGLCGLTATVVPRGVAAAGASGWNLGSAAVIVGTLVSAPLLTSAGGVVLAVVLVAAVVAVGDCRSGFSGWAWLYRALALLVLLSTPVGLVLAWMRRS